MITKVFVPLDSCLHIHVRSVSLFIRRFCRGLPENRLFPPSLRFLPDAGSRTLTRQPWKRKRKRSLMHHPLTSCSLLEACQPISRQDHRKSPSAGIVATVAEADVFSGAEECDGGRLQNEEDKRAEPWEKWRAGLRLWRPRGQNTCWVQARLVWLHLPVCSSSWCSDSQNWEERGKRCYLCIFYSSSGR